MKDGDLISGSIYDDEKLIHQGLVITLFGFNQTGIERRPIRGQFFLNKQSPLDEGKLYRLILYDGEEKRIKFLQSYEVKFVPDMWLALFQFED